MINVDVPKAFQVERGTYWKMKTLYFFQINLPNIKSFMILTDLFQFHIFVVYSFLVS